MDGRMELQQKKDVNLCHITGAEDERLFFRPPLNSLTYSVFPCKRGNPGESNRDRQGRLASISVFVELSTERNSSKEFVVLRHNKCLVLDVVHNMNCRLYVKATTATTT